MRQNQLGLAQYFLHKNGESIHLLCLQLYAELRLKDDLHRVHHHTYIKQS
jgi:hypothetical protein